MTNADWLQNIQLRHTDKSVAADLGTLYAPKEGGPWTLAGKPMNNEFELLAELVLLIARMKQEAA
jgi:hypothetical protein